MRIYALFVGFNVTLPGRVMSIFFSLKIFLSYDAYVFYQAGAAFYGVFFSPAFLQYPEPGQGKVVFDRVGGVEFFKGIRNLLSRLPVRRIAFCKAYVS